jgi:hypothetical protein
VGRGRGHRKRPYWFCKWGGGGSYSRSIIAVTPGPYYAIFVGGGGNQGVDGGESSVQLGGQTLISAPGGVSGDGGACFGGVATISRCGGWGGVAGSAAFGATMSPGPDGFLTGQGANALDPLSHAFPGYVLLTW